MTALVIGAAKISDYEFIKKYLEKDHIVIACDGGLEHTKNMGIEPDYIMGDFDSVNSEVFDFYKKNRNDIIKYPVKKDMTDMEIGFNFAVEKNADTVIIIGGIGSRLDHTLANCNLLFKAKQLGIKCIIENENNRVMLCGGENAEAVIEGKKGDTVSLVPLGEDVFGISLENMEYPLENYDLEVFSSRCISNVMKGDRAKVKIKKGNLFIIVARD